MDAKECMQKWRVHGEPRITITQAKQIYHSMDLNEYQFVIMSCHYMHNLFDQGTMISLQGIIETDTVEQLQAIMLRELLNVMMVIQKQDILEMQKSVNKILAAVGNLNHIALIIFNDTSEEVGVASAGIKLNESMPVNMHSLIRFERTITYVIAHPECWTWFCVSDQRSRESSLAPVFKTQRILCLGADPDSRIFKDVAITAHRFAVQAHSSWIKHAIGEAKDIAMPGTIYYENTLMTKQVYLQFTEAQAIDFINKHGSKPFFIMEFYKWIRNNELKNQPHKYELYVRSTHKTKTRPFLFFLVLSVFGDLSNLLTKME